MKKQSIWTTPYHKLPWHKKALIALPYYAVVLLNKMLRRLANKLKEKSGESHG